MSISIFLNLAGIGGGSQVAGYSGQIQLQTYGFGVTNQTAPTGGSVGKVVPGPMSVTKLSDAASGLLFIAACDGVHIATGTLSVVQQGAAQLHALQTFDMTEIFIESFANTSAGSTPTETITMTYKSLLMTTWVQTPTGTWQQSSDGWDFTLNRKI